MSEPARIQQDAERLRLLAIFHFVCAGLVALCAWIPLTHLALVLMRPIVKALFNQTASA